MKKLVIAVLLLAIVAMALTVYSKPILLKPLLGEGRILFPPMNAAVKINGESRTDIKCFRVNRYSDGQPANLIVVYRFIPSDGTNDVIIIDVNRQEAGLPNAGANDYYLLADSFLFQSDSGSKYVQFSSPKFDHNDPQYNFESSYIKFNIPTPEESPSKKLEIIINE